ncbi:MAG TPA: hypothetical protein VKS82_05020 [Streptosporangiaceae bacterium]|nr:hypothetical protein [Streptosporangiaceae bacterium]
MRASGWVFRLGSLAARLDGRRQAGISRRRTKWHDRGQDTCVPHGRGDLGGWLGPADGTD